MDRAINWILFVGITITVIAMYGMYREPVNLIHRETTNGAFTVIWFDTEKELQDYLGEPDLVGLTEYWPQDDMNFCVFYLVRPENVNDQYAFDTLGHELYHCTNGDWHD